MPYGTVNADVIQTSTSGGILGAGNASIMKNRIINGAMVIDQRNAGSAYTPTNNAYSLDRWYYELSQASKFSGQQNQGSVTPPTGYINYLGSTVTSAVSVGSTDYFLLTQSIEGLNCTDLGWGTANAKTVTLSFQVYSSLTGTFGGSLCNSAQNRIYPFSYTVSSANTWTTVSVTIAGDTSGTWLTTNGVGIKVRFGLGVGSTYSGTAGAWGSTLYFSATGATSVVGTNGATFYITGVQLEVGSSATGFEYVNYQTSLANCQRYYETSYEGVKVPTNTTASTVISGLGSTSYVGGGSGSTSQSLSSVAFKVTKRASPTTTIYSYTSSTTGVVSNGWSGADLTSGSGGLAAATTNYFNIYNASGASITVNSYAVLYHFSASAEL